MRAGKGIRRGLEIRKAAACCLLLPLLGVAIAVEEDALVVAERVAHEAHSDGREVLIGAVGDIVDEALALLCDSGVEDDIRVGQVLLGAAHTELELVAGEGERRRTVAVRVVAQDVRQGRDAEIHDLAAMVLRLLLLDESVDNRRQCIAQEDGDDCGRRLVRAETVIVAGRGDRETEQVCVGIDSGDQACEEDEELEVVLRIVARLEQVLAVGTY
jgi:hypothetical protein